MCHSFKATIHAIALLPAHQLAPVVVTGEGESKPAARAAAESKLREEVNSLRQHHGGTVTLQAIDAPILEEVTHG